MMRLTLANLRLMLADPATPILLVLSPLVMIAVLGRANPAVPDFGPSPYDYTVPALSLFFLFFLVTTTVNAVFRDVHAGVWSRLSCMYDRSTVIASKCLASILVGILQILLVWSGSFLLFHYTGILRAERVVLAAALAFATASLGLVVAAAARRFQRSMHISNLLVVVLGACGGGLAPPQHLSAAARAAGRLSPELWTLSGLSASAHTDWRSFGIALAVLVSWGLVGLAVALKWLRFETLRMD